MRANSLALGSLLIAAATMGGVCSTAGDALAASNSDDALAASNSDLVLLEDFSMALCPCSALFASDLDAKMLRDPTFSAIVDFRQPFVGTPFANASKGGPTKCFHGEGECKFQSWLLCAQNQSAPWPGRAWWDFQLCVDGTCSDSGSKLSPCTAQYENPGNATLLRDCSARAGLDFDALSACATGAEGAALMDASARYASAQGVSYGMQGLPVVRVNGKQISKFWDCHVPVAHVIAEVCAAYTGPKRPAKCANATAAGTASTTYELVAGLPHRAPDTLDESFWAIADPAHPRYLKHLSLDDAREIVGADAATVERVTAWFRDGLGAVAGSVRVSNLGDLVTATFVDNGGNGNSGIPTRDAYPVPLDFLLRRDPRSAPAAAAAEPTATATAESKRRLRRRAFSPGGGAYNVAAQKKAYGIPVDLQASNATGLQMVWGPGTFGFSVSGLQQFAQQQCPLLAVDKVKFDTANHGTPGGDNFGEGTLDTHMISSFGLNVNTLVSNTNTSASTEEGNGFGQAMLDFLTALANRKTLPQVLSLSLGSLSGASCTKLCTEAAKRGHSLKDCAAFLQKQRQVCMFLSPAQTARISAALQLLGARGVSVFGSSGDGGSHFSFGPYDGGAIADTLNAISCDFNFPVFPTSSPYIVSVGGTEWSGLFKKNPEDPVAWDRSGGGFSWQFDAPPHQNASVAAYLASQAGTSGFPAATAFNAAGRGYPDVAAISADGTSQSSPTMAGIWSLLTDHRLNAGLPPLGFLAPRLWKTMETYPGEAFQDVTSGNTKLSCSTGFPCAKGWDPMTGWGRPVWAGMIKHFGSDDGLAALKA